MRFITLEQAAETFRGKSVALVGGGPSALDNEPGQIDAYDVVVRINNYRTGEQQGKRSDVFYSFFGHSIRKSAVELKQDGVKLCMAKCPNAKALDSEWHERKKKQEGIDFRYIYHLRAPWWFCDTYVPTVERFVEQFEMLDRHIPTTGFSAILDVLACKPRVVYLTGFDFFASKLHNVSDKWHPGDVSDPIRHRPDLEQQWLADHMHEHLFVLDEKLSAMLNRRRAA